AVALGDGEGISVGDVVSLGSGVGEDFFFGFAVADALGEGETDLFFLGVGEGEADSFFVAADFFFLCGVGVGVGVEKIFLIFSPTDCAAIGGEGAKNATTTIVTAVKRNGVTT